MNHLTRLVAVSATMAMLSLSACAVDLGKLAADLQRPEVAFTHADAWHCDEQVKIPHGGKVEECSRCINASREPQPVSIAKVEQSVRSGGSVMLCSTRAWVSTDRYRGYLPPV